MECYRPQLNCGKYKIYYGYPNKSKVQCLNNLTPLQIEWEGNENKVGGSRDVRKEQVTLKVNTGVFMHTHSHGPLTFVFELLQRHKQVLPPPLPNPFSSSPSLLDYNSSPPTSSTAAAPALSSLGSVPHQPPVPSRPHPPLAAVHHLSPLSVRLAVISFF
ncbi:hypothetical protein M9H77_17043 [Catharanthus roseus]|uniref:Uncharacterized protein n=1 Tax=Catharanthus roseus TaxID=4058 RepID=A0ACC0B3G9_CATRO|nr:hypothetical protein M9H77_17043 [Catharanthus roseus]